MFTARREALAQRDFPSSRRIPYTAHVSAEIVATKAGELLQTFRLSGASFESADDETLNNWHERLNVTWRNIASPNVALWSHVVRRRSNARLPRSQGDSFADQLARRYQMRLGGETLMVNELYLTLIFRPVIGAAPSIASKLLTNRQSARSQTDLADSLDACGKIAETLEASLARYEPDRLGVYERNGRRYSAVLEFLGLIVNGESHACPLPQAPVSEVLATSRILFGGETLEYRSPTQTLRGAMLGIKEYPTPTVVGMCDSLLSAPFPFVLTQSFTFLSKATGQGLLQRQHARMANAGDFAVTQAEELVDALDALTSNEFVMGDHHFSLQVLSEPFHVGNEPQAERFNDHIALARAMLADMGMTVAREDLALEAAFWAQLPGNFSDRPRKAPITSRNFAALVTHHNYPSGRASGNHWGAALSLFVTSARSPYYFSLHASDPKDPDGGSRKDTGHTFICGPTGSGKTVFVGFILAMLHRQGVTQVVFDKDRGLEILIRALNGTYLPLKNGTPTGFNPLQLPPTAGNREFLKIWLRSLVRGTTPLSMREETDLDHALHATLALEPQARRLSRLIEFTDSTRSEGIHARLTRWCAALGGDYAWVFDNGGDTFASQMTSAALFGIDVTEFLDNEVTRPPLTLYLFHLVRTLLDGRRFVCWADEFSRLLADPSFEQFAKDGLKVWRKLNGVLAAATQSPSDALSSAISRTIIEQTPTKILFPNSDAHPEEYMAGFGLSEREFKLIKEQLEPGSRMFLVKQGHYSVVCQLDLKGFRAELNVISGRASAVEHLRRLIERVGPDSAKWLPLFQQEHEAIQG
jgi:type IV secretion system protein VirB4